MNDNKKSRKVTTLADQSIINNFLFKEMLDCGDESKWFCKTLVERITKKKFSHVELIANRKIQGIDVGNHGIELDVYVTAFEEKKKASEEDAVDVTSVCDITFLESIYNIEPNVYNMTLNKLLRRNRFYHSTLDSRLFIAGNDYDMLKDVITIFILPYDPLGAGRMVYTLKTRCLELPRRTLDDGSTSIFLYTRGTYEDTPENRALAKMLKYIENTTPANAGNDVDLIRMQAMVDRIRQNPEKGMKFMTYQSEMELAREESYDLGHAVGYDSGHAVGYDSGHAVGYDSGHAEGYSSGHDTGYESGHAVGVKEAWDEANEIISAKNKEIERLKSQLQL